VIDNLELAWGRQISNNILFSSVSNSTINNSKLYGASIGIQLQNSPFITINGVQTYNNNYGIFLSSSNNFVVNNVQAYNNSSYGMDFRYSDNGSINNSQFYNNAYGVRNRYSYHSILNQTQIYNNLYGLYEVSYNSLWNNVDIYNNQYGISDNKIVGTYYGSIRVFNNQYDNLHLLANMTTWTQYQYLWWTIGSTWSWPSMDCDRASNPLNGLSNYLLSNNCDTIGRISAWASTPPVSYTYGKDIQYQDYPVRYLDSDIDYSYLCFDNEEHIGQYVRCQINSLPITGDFVINSGDAYATTGNVALGMNINNSTHMKFGNSSGQRDAAYYQAYASSIPWILSGGEGERTVYGVFRNYGNIFYYADSIFLNYPPHVFWLGHSHWYTTGTELSWQVRVDYVDDLDQFVWTLSGENNKKEYPIYDSGLVLMMNFDNVLWLGETTGLIIKDWSQYGNHGTGINTPAWTGNGKWWGAYQFNGSNNYIVTNNISLENTFSVGAWVYVSSGSSYKRILETTFQSWFYLWLDNSWTRYQWIVNNKTAPYGNVSWGVVQLNTRQHIFATYDGTTWYLYVDGNLVASGAFTPPWSTSYPLYIGIYYLNQNNYQRSWLIDEPRIYNRALTSGEVHGLYVSNLNRFGQDDWNFVIQDTWLSHGRYTYYACATDLIGSTWCTETKELDVDLIPPSGIFAINNADEYTTGLNVTLYNAVVGADRMKFGNSTGERDDADWTWYASTYPWTLSGDTEWTKTVYGIFENEGFDHEYRDDIIYDINPPWGYFLINTWAKYTASKNVQIGNYIYDEGAGLSGMKYGNSTGGRDAASWIPYTSSYARTLDSGIGPKTIRWLFDDKSGKEYDPTSSIILDDEAPLIIFTWSTPASGAIVTGHSFPVSLEITDHYLHRFERSLWTQISSCRVSDYFDIGDYSCLDTFWWLVLAMNFDNILSAWETTWATIKDRSTRSNTWIAQGGMTRTTDGKYKGAYIFDGVDDYIRITNHPSMNVWGRLTLSARIKPQSATNTCGGSRWILHKWSLSTTGAFALYIDENNYLSFALNQWELVFTGSTPVAMNTWQHVLVSYDHTENNQENIRLYIDGVLHSTGIYTGAIARDTEDLFVGVYQETWCLYSWVLDDLRIYANALNQNEIANLYYSSLQKTSATSWTYTTIKTWLQKWSYLLDAFAEDYAGNRGYATERTIFLDLAPLGNFYINDDEEKTQQHQVQLTLSWIYNADHMRFGNSTGERDAAFWISYDFYHPRTLTWEDGTKTVYGEFKTVGWLTYSTEDSIVLDTQWVTWSFLINSGAQYTTGLNVQLQMNVTGATRMKFANSWAELFFAEITWYQSTFSWVLSWWEDGERTVYAWFADTQEEGNQIALERNIFLDMTPPLVTIDSHISGQIINISGLVLTWETENNALITITWSTIVGTTTTGSMDAYQWNITLSEWENLVTVFAQDAAGNVSSVSIVLILDTVWPSIVYTGVTPPHNYISNQDSFTSEIAIEEEQTSLSRFYWGGASQSHSFLCDIPIYKEVSKYSALDYDDSRLILAMNFDNILSAGETTWETIRDWSPQQNHGTGYTTITRTGGGKYGGAYVFDGVDDYISIADSDNDFDLSDSISISLRVYPTAINSDQKLIAKWWTIAGWSVYEVSISEDNRYRFGIWGEYVSSDTPLSTGERTHVLVTYDDSNVKIYINGVLDKEATITQTPFNDNHPLMIGSFKWSEKFFSWMLDDIRIYNDVLNDLEVRYYYHSELASYDTNKWLFTTYQTWLGHTIFYQNAFAEDLAGNRSDLETRTYIFDKIGPTVGVAQIYSWATWYNDAEYYKWVIDIRAEVYDLYGIDWSTCEYTINSWVDRDTAESEWSYCKKTWLDPQEDIFVAFRVKDTADNIWSWVLQTYLHDNVWPNKISLEEPSPYTGAYVWTSYVMLRRSAAIDTWVGMPDLSGYYYRLSLTPNFEEPLYMSWYTNGTGITIVHMTDRPYYWTIEAIDALQNTWEKSETGLFTVDTTPPTQVQLISPASWTILNTGNVSLERSGAVDTWAGISGYWYQISDDSGFSTILLSGFQTITGVDLLFSQDNTYYRRVYAVDNVGNTWDWSEIWEFMIDETAPRVFFTGSTPASGTIQTTGYFTTQIGAIETGAGLDRFTRHRNGLPYSFYDSGLVLMMNFENVVALGETTGVIVKDWSHYGNHGTGINSPTWTSNGKRWRAYQFNGSNYITLGDRNILDLTTEKNMTIALRYYKTSSNITPMKLINKGMAIAWTPPSVWYQLRLNNSLLEFTIRDTNTITHLTWIEPSINTRHYVVGTINRDQKLLSLYINNILIATWDITDIGDASTNIPFAIAMLDRWAYGSATEWFIGRIDEPRVYNRALTSWEISQLYLSNFAKYDTWSREFSSNQTGLTDNTTYYYSGCAGDLVGNTWCTETRNITYDWTIPQLIFTWDNPDDNARTSWLSITGQMQITKTWAGLGQFIWNRQNNLISFYDSGLVLMMNFDNVLWLGETTGQIIKDRSHYGNHGTGINTPTWTGNGKWWGAYEFDRSSAHYITLPTISAINQPNNTICTWIRPSANNLLYNTFFNQEGWLNSQEHRLELNNDWRFVYRTWSGWYLEVSSIEVIQTGLWTYICTTRSWIIASIYINGIFNKSWIIYDINTTINTYIWALRPGLYFTWFIDEVRIYNRTLSSWEISQLYLSNFAKYDTWLWSFVSLQSGLVDGTTYYYTGTAIDFAGNSISTGRKLNVDQTNPRVFFTGSTPASGTIQTTGYFTTQIGAIETGAGLDRFTRHRNGLPYSFYDSGLVLMMNFNNKTNLGETTGVIVKDWSQYGNHGTGINSPTWTSNGKRGGAYQFNGSNQYIEIKDNPSFDTISSDNFSIFMWVNYSITWSNGQYTILNQIQQHTNRRYFVARYNQFWIAFHDGDWNWFYVDPNISSTWERYFLGITRSGTQLRMWKNGIQIGSTQTISKAIINPSANINIWRNSNASPITYFSWLIDEPRIYSRTLSSWEISQLYLSNFAKYDTWSREFSSNQTGLTDNTTYYYSGCAGDLVGNTWCTETRNITITPNPTIYFTGATPTEGSTGYFNNFRPEIEIIQTELMDTFSYTFNDISYPYYDSGLRLMMNFDNVATLGETTGIVIKDVSQYGNHGTGINTPTRISNGRRWGAYEFSETNRIDLWNTLNMGTLNFSIWVRIKINQHKNRNGIIGKGYLWNSANGYGIYVNTWGNVVFQIRINMATATGVVSDQPINTGERYYIVATRRYNGISNLYINGIQQTNTINEAYSTTSTQSFFIGRGMSTDSRLSWFIDEVRLWRRILTSWEIYQMRRSNLSKYDTDKRRFIDDRQCMADGTYTYTGYVSNIYQLNSTTGRWNTISITGYTPYAPESFFIGNTGVSQAQVTLSWQFTGYFKLEDRKGITWRYTTIQLPLVFSGMTYANNKIENDGTNVRFMATGVDMTEGTNSWAVYINPDIATETGSLWALHYIKRVNNRTGYSCPAGVYANKPYISIDIPGRQNPDIYSGLITIDFVQ